MTAEATSFVPSCGRKYPTRCPPQRGMMRAPLLRVLLEGVALEVGRALVADEAGDRHGSEASAARAAAMLFATAEAWLAKERLHCLRMTARYAIVPTLPPSSVSSTRAAMLLALLDGRALPRRRGLRDRSRASPPQRRALHLAKLTRGGLLAVRDEGRHRYYRLASEDVAHALEALGVIATARPPPRARLSPERDRAPSGPHLLYDHSGPARSPVSLADHAARARAHPLRGGAIARTRSRAQGGGVGSRDARCGS